MNILKNIIDSYRHIPYTIKHYFAFRKLEKEMKGENFYHFHDVDKILMYLFLPFLGTKKIKEIHQKLSRHHILNEKSSFSCNYVEAMIDWECARVTKKDKTMTARECLEFKKDKLNRDHYICMDVILKKYNL